jgi:hypothetical protein
MPWNVKTIPMPPLLNNVGPRIPGMRTETTSKIAGDTSKFLYDGLGELP